jgi:subtilisin family serine protease
MVDILKTLTENGVVVVASAGNDATTRPCFPAAFSRSKKLDIPVVSVGALNPNKWTDALFSNVGDWVTMYRNGAAVFSTMPTELSGGMQPASRLKAEGRRRESLDPDDFSSGFGIWSGTSFASPVAAGDIAREMIGRLEEPGKVFKPSVAVTQAMKAVTACLKT